MKRTLAIVSVALASLLATTSVGAYDETYGNTYNYDYDCDLYGRDMSNTYSASVASDGILRDDRGVAIGTLGSGSSVQVIGTCTNNPSRTLVYDPNTGCYGSIANVYLYGEPAPSGEQSYNCYAEQSYDCNTYYQPENTYYGQSYIDNSNDYYEPDYGNSYQPTYDTTNYDYSEYNYNEYDYSYQESIVNNNWSGGTEPYVNPSDYTYYDYSNAEGWDNEDWDDDDDGSYMTWTQSTCVNENVWIDVDIASQRVNVYSGDTVILSGDCVTGTAGSRDTPCGEWYILNKVQDTTLIGVDYECPVSYWMPFTETGCGFHDADWRGAFGGDIYQYDGSHGCVNLEHGFAEQMYSVIQDGALVKVH